MENWTNQKEHDKSYEKNCKTHFKWKKNQVVVNR